MFRQRSSTLLTLSVSIFVAAIGGVTLGKSAVGAINPLYFDGPARPPRAVDGTIRQPAEPAYYQAYNWEQGNAARLVACGDNCGAPRPYDPYAFAEAEPRLAGPGWREQTAAVELEPWQPGQVGAPRSDSVMRYADYPVEAKPDEAEDQPAPPADYQDPDVYEDE